MAITRHRAINKPVQLVKHSWRLDSTRRYLTDSPTPARFANIMQAVDNGDVAAMVELNEEMEAKDPHLQGEANKRREGLTALEWEVLPDTKAKDQDAAQEAADFCQEQLDGIKSWPDTLEHFATAIGPGVAVVENVWHRGRLVHTEDVPGHRLDSDPSMGPEIRIITEEAPIYGVPARQPKFVVFTPHARAGFPLRVTITRAQALLWLIKHFSQADWSAFSEVYGQPTRIATTTKDIPPDAQATVKNMLQNMGTDGWALFPEGIEVEFKEAARGTQPYGTLIDWVERKQSILYLGQTLTTEPGQVGSLALGRVHDNVRASLTLSDMGHERRMIGNQILRPMVRFRWPGRDMPIPIWTRRIIEEKNLDADRVEMDRLRLAREFGLRVDQEVVYERLGLPMPKEPKENANGEPS